MTDSPNAKHNLVLAHDEAPQRFDETIEDLAYLLTPEKAKRLRDAHLSGAEWNLWAYLVTLSPSKFRIACLPPLEEVLLEMGMNRSEFFYAIAKLEEYQLVAFVPEFSDYQYA